MDRRQLLVTGLAGAPLLARAQAAASNPNMNLVVPVPPGM